MDLKFIKKNKFTFFVIFFFLILFILLLQVKNIFFPETGDANYGNRLDGIVEISKNVLSDATTKLKENEKVVDAQTTVAGKIINIIITVDDGLSQKDSRKIAEASKDSFSEEILKSYDIQLFVKKNSEAENDFPIIGYKAKNSDAFSWTKERSKTTEEETKS